MKKIIFKYLIFISIILLSLIVYLSTVGIETNKFNNQISNLIKNINKDLEIELKKIKLILDPINLKINLKTLGSKIKIRENKIDIESINTSISINSYFKKKFSLTNLEISSNSLEIKNLISFFRNIEDQPELYILENVIKKGYLISNIYFEFDEQGKIKDNYNIKGFIRDGKLSIFKKYQIEEVDSLFNISKDNFVFKDINLSFNKTDLLFENILIKKIREEFLISGSFENKEAKIQREMIDNFFNLIATNYKINNINLESKNNFKFKLNKKFKISNLKLSSKIQINNLDFKNILRDNDFFSNNKDIINIQDHSINIDYENNKLLIKGSGYILLQEKENKIEYSISKKNDQYDFKTSLFLEKNPFQIDLLGYQKDKNLDAMINLDGIYIYKKKLLINSASLIENNNKFNFKKLNFGKDLRITDLEKINFDYIDKNKIRNILKLEKKNNKFYLSGKEFNADYLIENLIKNDEKNKIDFIDKDFDLNINIKKVHLDQDYKLKTFSGNLNFQNREIKQADINGFFTEDKKFKFTVKTNDNNKVTTLFLDEAEPLIKRYKFIKGFTNGSLDFYSINNKGKTDSTLKIYDFNLGELPILTKILTLASLQGIADLLSGEGITFDEFEMNFENDKKRITINEIYAIGPAISILTDGYYIEDDLISLRGTLVPATTINKFIGSIPVLGKILVGQRMGEGVFGVSFKIKGPPKDPKTSVNPIKTLTPRFITRTLEKIKKN